MKLVLRFVGLDSIAAVETSAGTTSLTYDYESRVTGITYPNQSTNSFTYNGLDTRVGMSDSGGSKSFLRDGVSVTSPVLSDGSATYTPAISERRSSTTTFYHAGIKNGDSQTSTGQSVTASIQYDSFGNVTSSSGTWQGPFAYGGPYGYQSDSDSGLKLLGHRYYDPSTGRFLTRDPAKDGRNWYSYCDNNPLLYCDPAGLERVVIVVGQGNDDEKIIPDRFDDLAGKLRRELERDGHTVEILYSPSKDELARKLDDADSIIYIGHGNSKGWAVRQRGGTPYTLTPGVLQKMRKGRKFRLIVGVTCDMFADKETGDMWSTLGSVVFGFPDVDNHVNDFLKEFDSWKRGKPGVKLPRISGDSRSGALPRGWGGKL